MVVLGERRPEAVQKRPMADILPVYGPEQAWLITDLLHDLKCLEKIP